ncbi:doublesex- and mab-3-related transcription factor A2-like [Alosa sapidissima]|uniref:doublesex- and mab-3-related transcription factor A2-like n=1 Tax=Alosa sapidissima TaxID=34773 RepID=UPI001C0831D4|nr:doublesex- and mab-3-related transcription factor A2-like [Alosa sapidissima]
MMAYVSVNSASSVQKAPRNPKCARCRNHGFVVPLKGHSGKCQFFSCKCWKCSLITERTKIMATQRRLKKSQRDEIAIKESLAVLANQASTATVNGDVLDRHTLPHATVHEASNASLRSDGVSRMPAGGTEDSKTFVELEVAPNALNDHFTRQTTGGGIEVGVGGSRSSGPVCGAPDVLTMNRNSGEMVAERVQRNVYMGERMTVPLHVYSYPNGYACPAILVNLQPQVPFKDPFTFRHPQSGLAYASDPVSPQDGCMPVFTPYSMSCPGLLEEVPMRHHLYFPQHRESGGGRLMSRAHLDSAEKLQDSQGSDIVSVDDSSQDTA